MRIILLTSATNRSGGARQALYLARGLAGRGHDVSFFVPQGAELPTLDPEPSFTWHRLPESRGRWRGAVESVLYSGGPAVFHAYHNRAVKLAAWWGLFWRRRGHAVIGHRGVCFRPNNPLPYWSPGIDAFIANSRACADTLRAKGVSRRRLHVVYNGIPDERITPLRPAAEVRSELGVPETCRVIGTVGNDSENKGTDVLLKAFAEASLVRTHLVVAGVTPEKFTPLCNRLGIGDMVSLVPPLENVADLMQTFDLFALPSRSESSPNTLLEAMRMGLPAVGTDVGGVPELIDGNGFLVPPGDAEALADALVRSFADPTRLAAFANRSRLLGREFTLENKVARTEAVYEAALKR